MDTCPTNLEEAEPKLHSWTGKAFHIQHVLRCLGDLQKMAESTTPLTSTPDTLDTQIQVTKQRIEQAEAEWRVETNEPAKNLHLRRLAALEEQLASLLQERRT